MRAALIAIAALSVATPASAQQGTAPRLPDGNLCSTAPAAGTPREKVDACTRLLDAGTLDARLTMNALVYRGMARRTLRQFVEARTDFNRALAQSTAVERASPTPTWSAPGQPTGSAADRAYILRELGYTEAEADAQPAAVAAFTRAIAADPTEPESYTARAYALLLQKKLQQALVDANTAVAKGPRFTPAWKTRARIRHTLGDKDAAFADSREALAISPGDPDALRLHGLIAADVKQYEAAIKSYETLIALVPKHSVALNSACWIRAAHLRREYDIARRHCDAAIALNPEANSYDSRGLVGLRQGRYQSAWDDYNTAATKDPKMASALYGRGVAGLRIGRTAQARADLAAAGKLGPAVAASYDGYGIVP